MADNDKQPVPAQEVESSEVTESKKKGGKLLMLIGIAVFLVSLLTGGWMAYANYEKLAAAARVMGLVDEAAKPEKEEKAPKEFGEFTELKGIVVNPADSNGERYLLVNIGLESTEAAVLEEISGKEVAVRDTVLKILGLYTVEKLADINQRAYLKSEIRNAVNDLLVNGEVNRVYFTQYVIQ